MMRKNVLLIIPEMITGGAQRSMANISLELSRYVNVWLVVFNTEQPVAYRHGGEFLNLDIVPGKSIFSKLVAFYKRIKRLKRIKRDLRVEVSISFLEGADYVNVLSRQREKVILSIRGSKIHDEIMRSSSFWLRSKILIPWLYRRADSVIAVSAGIGRELVEYYGIDKRRLSIIGNFYDADGISTLATDPKNPELEQLYADHPVLVSVGRLNKEKGLHYLIKIFAALKKRNHKVKFVLVGDGPEKNHLIHLCNDLKLSVAFEQTLRIMPDVLLLGNQANVFKYLKSAALYLTNSSSEGFPNGIVEAMICKVPVVSSDCPYGPAEILAPGGRDSSGSNTFGVLLPIATDDSSIKTWVDAIEKLLSDVNGRLALADRAFVRAQQFRKDDVVGEWLRIIHE